MNRMQFRSANQYIRNPVHRLSGWRYARIVGSRTLRPDRNDVPLGSISTKNLIERLDLVLGNDDRASPDSPTTDVGQEPRLPDDVRLLPDPLLSPVSVDLSEELSALAGGQTARLVAYEAERLEVELARCHARKAAKEDPALADDGFEELLVEGVALLRAIVDDAELHVELAVEGEEDLPCGILRVWVALNEDVDLALFRCAAPRRRAKQDCGSHAWDRGELPSRRPDGFLKAGRIHPSTSRQMDSMVSKLFRAFARSARVPEFPETNLARALWSR